MFQTEGTVAAKALRENHDVFEELGKSFYHTNLVGSWVYKSRVQGEIQI